MTEDHRHALPRGYVLGDYRIERLLGHGGFGLTYLGVHSRISTRVAIKEYLPADLAVRESDHSVAPKSTSDREVFEWGRERFLDEARTLARFRHRNIVRILDYFEAHGTACIVMDYVEGRTLAALLEESEPADERDLMRFLFPLLDGLAEIHRASFLHRDIKPSNIMMQDDGTPVLIDFGAARQALGGRSRSMTSVVTPGYAPIEQYSTSAANQGPWTDVYALGAVAYRALTGRRPPDAPDRLRNDPIVPAGVAARGRCRGVILEAIDWALAVNEEERPQNVEDWRAALARADEDVEEAVIELGENEHEPSLYQPLPDRKNDRGILAWLPLILLLAVIAAIAVPLLIDDVPRELPSRPAELPAPADPGEAENALGLGREARSQVQRALNEAGFDAGSEDGVFGARTREAIRNYQERNGYAGTGYITWEQRDHLLGVLQRRTPPGATEAPRTPDSFAPRDVKGLIPLSERDAVRNTFRQAMQQCWKIPAGADREPNIAVTVWITFDPDGSVNTVGLEESTVGKSEQWRTVAESAMRAVRMCSPYDLPRVRYDVWKEMSITFHTK